jgi:hypothetical protein
MTADPGGPARRPLDRTRETTKQLGGPPALSDSLARGHDSLTTTQASAPD